VVVRLTVRLTAGSSGVGGSDVGRLGVGRVGAAASDDPAPDVVGSAASRAGVLVPGLVAGDAPVVRDGDTGDSGGTVVCTDAVRSCSERSGEVRRWTAWSVPAAAWPGIAGG